MSEIYISGNFVTPQGIRQTTALIRDGKIVDFLDKAPQGSNHHDFSGKYILPGLIEVHGHLREPGFENKGDVPHETRAALAGGVTTVIDMPNTKPPTVTRELLDQKIKTIYPGRSYSDYAFFMGVASDKLSEIEKVDKSKIVGVKIFMAGHETTPTTIPDDETLKKVLIILAKRGILGAIHAEDQELINELNRKFSESSDPATWSEMRPKEVVIKAVQRALSIGKELNSRLYLLHLSTPEEFDLVDKAKKDGMEVYGELVGYQLVFSTNDYSHLGNKIKVAPALRSPKDQDEMWARFRNGGIDVFCSEHTPHEWETKNQDDVRVAQAGTPGIQETLPAIITTFIKRFGKENLEECLTLLAKYWSQNPAKIFGFTTTGSLEVGKDADLVVLDTNQTWTVEKADLFSKCGWSAYEGMELTGRPIATFLRGDLVYKNGKILGEPHGKWINH